MKIVDDPNWSSLVDDSPSDGLALDVVVVSPANHVSDDNDNNGSNDTSCSSTVNGQMTSSDFFVHFPKFKEQPNFCNSSNTSETAYTVLLQINQFTINTSFLSMSLPNAKHHPRSDEMKKKQTKNVEERTEIKVTSPKKQQCVFNQGLSTKPSTEALQKLVDDGILNPGKNDIRYVLASYNYVDSIDERTCTNTNNNDNKSWSEQEKITQTSTKTPLRCQYKPIDSVNACIYLWNVRDHVIVVDIDGTLTKSDVRGVISTVVKKDYKHVHDGACAFFSNLVKLTKIAKNDIEDNNCICDDSDDAGGKAKNIPNKNVEITNCSSDRHQKQSNETAVHEEEQIELNGRIRILYLSSRPVQLMDSTRKFISNVSQFPFNQNESNKKRKDVIGVTQCMSCFNPSISEVENDSVSEFNFCDLGINCGEKMYERHTKTMAKTEVKQSSTQLLSEDLDESKAIISQLPDGPIFLHPGSLSTVLLSELKKTVYKYKADTLMRQVVLPFAAAGKGNNQKYTNAISGTSSSPKKDNIVFIAGFGNKATDAKAYEIAGMRKEDIFIINKGSKVTCADYNCHNNFNSGEMIKAEGTNENDKSTKPEKDCTFSGYNDKGLIRVMLNKIQEAMT